MQAFTHYTPTEIVFGKASEDKVAELAKKYHGSRVFVVYGGGSVVKSGLLERVTGTLEAAGLKVETIGGVKPNPRLDFAREAVKKAIEFQADLILAVGGGSVIDTAKAVSHGAANPDTDIWEFWSRKKKSKEIRIRQLELTFRSKHISLPVESVEAAQVYLQIVTKGK